MTQTNADLCADLRNVLASLHSRLANIDVVGQAILASGGAIRVGPPPPPIKGWRQTIAGAQEDLKFLNNLTHQLIASGMLHADS